MTTGKLLASLTVLAGMLGQACAQVVITDSGVTEKEVKTKEKAKEFSYIQKRRKISVKSTGPVNYSFAYNYTDDPAFKKNIPRLPFPSIGDSSVGSFGVGLIGGGWYGGGFLGVRVNKRSLHTVVADRIEVVKHAERGIVDFVWKPKQIEIKARFVFLPGDDKLYSELTFTPREQIDSLELTMICIPGHWGRVKPTERWLATDIRSVSRTEKEASFDLEKENWILHFDAKDNRVGTCAVMYLPDQLTKAEAHIGDPITRTNFILPPDTQKVRMIFWSFPDSYKKPVDAYHHLKKNQTELLEKLRKFDFE
tara:strand:+ start:78 stop:1004 length:927 start_codon:yes stop_codon:yes gene_type:complete